MVSFNQHWTGLAGKTTPLCELIPALFFLCRWSLKWPVTCQMVMVC